MIVARRWGLLRLDSIFRRTILTIPDTVQEFYGPSNKEITFVADMDHNSLIAFKLASLHFPKTWGFLWRIEQNTLPATILNYSEDVRQNFYQQLTKRDCSFLKERINKKERSDIVDNGLIAVGGEIGKKVISEAYQCVGLPPLVSYNCDLVFGDLKNKVPMKWIVTDSPVAYNIHPAPPEKPGAGVYVPSLFAGEKEYGITTHYITETVDNGSIISVRRFPIPEGSTKTSLRNLTRQYCLESLEDLLLHMKFTDPLTDISTCCHYTWRGTEITRRMARKMAREMEEKIHVQKHMQS